MSQASAPASPAQFPTSGPATLSLSNLTLASQPLNSNRQEDGPASKAASQSGTAAAAETATNGPGLQGTPLQQCMAQYNQGATAMQHLLQQMLNAVENERKALEEARDQLARERQQFEAEASRVQHVLKDNEQVVLNVGGKLFTTTVTTLRNAPCPSLFNAMFSGRHELKRDEQGCIFIDRDGRHFHDVLNFLRDGQFNYPQDGSDFKYLMELRAEAEYYGLTGLVTQIDRYPYSVTRVNRAVSLNPDDSWMYEDGQDEVVFSVDKPCQLLGVGLCGTEGSITAELELYEVDAQDFAREISTLSCTAQSYTKADGQLVKLMLPAPINLQAGKFYMLSALIKGTESFCCEDCLDCAVAAGVKVRFHHWESPNGTNEGRGQFPELYIRVPGNGLGL